jgi:NADP-dependent 3-hydroxy acid dehydrogenase YdfG
MKLFADRVAVITGAGSGIGRALAVELAGRGARLAISDIDTSAVAATAELARAVGAEVEHHTLDVSDREAVFAHADAVEERFGSVNLLINNAGVAVSKTVLEMPLEDIEWLMGINFWGVVYGTKAFLPKLIASGDGHLVNLSSIFGMIGVPEQSAYNAAKFAVRGFTEALRQEMLMARLPVKVSCVHPGGVKTGIARNARSATRSSEELAQAFDRIAMLRPERAAQIILSGVERDRPRIFVGRDAHAIDLMQRILGSGYERIVARAAARAL